MQLSRQPKNPLNAIWTLAIVGCLCLIVGIYFMIVPANKQPTLLQSNIDQNVTKSALTGSTTNAVTSQPINAKPVTFFRGLINQKYAIEMRLEQNGNTLSGTYSYKKFGIPISLKGTLNPDKSFLLNGYDKQGTHIDILSGRFITVDRIEGNWSKPAGGATMSLTLSAIK